MMGEKEAQTNSGEYSNIVSSRRVNACTGADAERFRQRRARLRMTHHFRERFDERGFGGVGRRGGWGGGRMEQRAAPPIEGPASVPTVVPLGESLGVVTPPDRHVGETF